MNIQLVSGMIFKRKEGIILTFDEYLDGVYVGGTARVRTTMYVGGWLLKSNRMRMLEKD